MPADSVVLSSKAFTPPLNSIMSWRPLLVLMNRILGMGMGSVIETLLLMAVLKIPGLYIRRFPI